MSDRQLELARRLRQREMQPHGVERYEEATGQPFDPGYTPPPAERSPQGVGTRALNAQEALERGDPKLLETLKRRQQR